MDQNSLDKIAQALSDHKTPLDKDALWKAIDKNRPRRYPLTLLMGISTLMVISLLGFQYFTNTEEAIVPDNYSKTAQLVAPPSQIIAEPTHADLTKTSETTVDKLAPRNEIEKPNTKNNRKTSTPHKPAITKQKIYLENKITLADSKKNIPTGTSTAAITTSTLANQISTTSNSLDNTIVSKLQNLTAPVGIESVGLSSLDYQRTKPKTKLPFRKKNKTECFDHGKKNEPWYLEIYGTVDMIGNEMTTENDFSNYLAARKNTQTQLEGYRTGIRLKYQIKNGLYFKTGLEAGWIRNRFQKEEVDTTIKILANQLLDTYVRGDSTYYVYGDKAAQVINRNSWKVYNTHRSIGIPLLLGYELSQKRLSYGFELGMIHNIVYNVEGIMLDPTDLKPTDAQYLFRDRIRTSLTGGLSVGYKVNELTKLSLITSMKRNLAHVNADNNPIRQLHNSYGVGLSLQFKM